MTNSIAATNQSASQPVTQTAPAAKKATAAAPEASEASKPKAATKLVVQISDAGKAALLQEATESEATTAAEAQGGDRQAQRLLAKQAAAKIH